LSQQHCRIPRRGSLAGGNAAAAAQSREIERRKRRTASAASGQSRSRSMEPQSEHHAMFIRRAAPLSLRRAAAG